MKKIFISFLLIALFASCEKEEIVQNPAVRPVVVQMEVVNAAGHSTFYQQQLVK